MNLKSNFDQKASEQNAETKKLALCLKELSQHEQFDKLPKKIVWLSGAPGAGKGTQENYIIEYYNLYKKPLVASSLLMTDEMREKINQGFLLDDSTVVSAVFKGLMNPIYAQGVLVDGYPRTLGQAECIRWLWSHYKEQGIPVDFKVIVFMLDEAESVRRQLYRGKQAMKHNERVHQTGKGKLLEVRQTDLDPAIAKQRYAVFMKETYAALQSLKDDLPFIELMCTGDVKTVQQCVLRSLSGFDQKK